MSQEVVDALNFYKGNKVIVFVITRVLLCSPSALHGKSTLRRYE
jgi:hypothetical protein